MLPHFAYLQATMGTPISLESLQPGDLLFYKNSSGKISHVAIYAGNFQVIEAAGPTGNPVAINSMWLRRPSSAVRILN
jgi:cell wall-associated NlpC family hydrolase